MNEATALALIEALKESSEQTRLQRIELAKNTAMQEAVVEETAALRRAVNDLIESRG
ncbi:MAG: hypothetical protein H9W81_13445 [Enterococcus sp.]|nr:hypothetical protein [Enterococcus sp.]